MSHEILLLFPNALLLCPGLCFRSWLTGRSSLPVSSSTAKLASSKLLGCLNISYWRCKIKVKVSFCIVICRQIHWLIGVILLHYLKQTNTVTLQKTKIMELNQHLIDSVIKDKHHRLYSCTVVLDCIFILALMQEHIHILIPKIPPFSYFFSQRLAQWVFIINLHI